MLINIPWTHASNYNRLNYGNGMCNRACCFVTCNYGSKLSVQAHLDEYVKVLSWKSLYLIIQPQCFSWLGPPLLWGVLSSLSSINSFLPWVRRQVLLCIPIKNWCHKEVSSSWGRVLLDSPYLITKTPMWFEFIFLSAILFATCTCLWPPSKVRLASIPKHTQLYPHPNLHPSGSIPSSYNSLTPVPTFSLLASWFLTKYQLKCHLQRFQPFFP